MGRSDERLYSIKLIHPNHLKYPYFTEDFDGQDGRLPLMNFSAEGNGPSIATNLPIGHRSLVYVIQHQKFIWAIEYIGTLEAGRKAALAHGVEPNDITTKWSLFRPIRFLARVSLEAAPTADDIYKRTGIKFTANAFTLKYISAGEYQTIYDAIDWQTKVSDQGPAIATASPVRSLPIPIQAPAFEIPPVANAQSLLERIQHVQGLPERNMEDVVKAFLVSLGYPESSICFQIGHVDVRVNDGSGKAKMVVEVKRSLLIEKVWRDARRKGFDYATEVGAGLVIVTDADIYEVYDRNRGTDYESMLCGRFQLTKFTAADAALVDLLRP